MLQRNSLMNNLRNGSLGKIKIMNDLDQNKLIQARINSN